MNVVKLEVFWCFQGNIEYISLWNHSVLAKLTDQKIDQKKVLTVYHISVVICNKKPQVWPMQKQHNFSYVWKICHKSLKTVFLSIGHCNESPYSGFPNLLLSKFNAKTVCNFIKSCKFMKFICIFKSYGIFNNIF